MDERDKLIEQIHKKFPHYLTGRLVKFIEDDRQRIIKEYKTAFFCDFDCKCYCHDQTLKNAGIGGDL